MQNNTHTTLKFFTHQTELRIKKNPNTENDRGDEILNCLDFRRKCFFSLPLNLLFKCCGWNIPGHCLFFFRSHIIRNHFRLSQQKSTRISDRCGCCFFSNASIKVINEMSPLVIWKRKNKTEILLTEIPRVTN